MRILTALVGPTGVGKTAISIALAQRLQGEIISSDSMQIYEGLNIGTAKIAREEMGGIPHHLLDICDPRRSFSVAEFQQAAYRAMEEIWERGHQPMLVGGTGLYLNAVIYGYNFAQQAVNEGLRQQLLTEAQQHGNGYLLEKLNKLDPKVAARLHQNDTKRIVRAIEVALQSDRVMHELEANNHEVNFKPIVFGLHRNRPELYQRINQRVDQMFNQGLIAEVEALWQQGLLGPIARQALGYKEVVDYLNGLSTKREMVTVLKRETRRYAKRQLTWFRKNKEIIWFDLDQSSSVTEIIDRMVRLHAGLTT